MQQANPAEAATVPDPEECARIARLQDRDRYLLALYAPSGVQRDLFALIAFNQEIAKTREVVTEPLAGMIRLQWWRDGLDAAYSGGAVPRHSVMTPLADAIARHGLDRSYFETLLDARELDLDDDPFRSTADLAAYAEATNAPLLYLMLQILGAHDTVALEAARHAGAGWGLVGLLRAIPHHAAQQRRFLSEDVMAEAGLTEAALYRDRDRPALCRAVSILAETAHARIAAGRDGARAVPRAAHPALLSLTLADVYLEVLRKSGWDPTRPRVQMAHPLAPLRLLWAAATGRL